MKNAVRIKTMSQWYLLKQLNPYLGKKKNPRRSDEESLPYP